MTNDSTDKERNQAKPFTRWINFFKSRQIKIDLPYEAPGRYIIFFIMFLFVFLTAGGIYTLTEDPLLLEASAGNLLLIAPFTNRQYLIETILSAILIAMGASGLYLIRYSTRYAYDERMSVNLLVIGTLLTVIAGAILTIMYNEKKF